MSEEILAKLKENVIQGRKTQDDIGIDEDLAGTPGVLELTEAALKENIAPEEIITRCLTAGMQIVGEKFTAKEYFVPDMLASADEVDVLLAIRVLEEVLGTESRPLAEPARILLARAAGAEPLGVRRRAFQVLVPVERESRFDRVLGAFVGRDPDLFDAETARKYREFVLSAGNTADPMELYKKFRGKEPSIDPLLEKRGLK